MKREVDVRALRAALERLRPYPKEFEAVVNVLHEHDRIVHLFECTRSAVSQLCESMRAKPALSVSKAGRS